MGLTTAFVNLILMCISLVTFGLVFLGERKFSKRRINKGDLFLFYIPNALFLGTFAAGFLLAVSFAAHDGYYSSLEDLLNNALFFGTMNVIFSLGSLLGLLDVPLFWVMRSQTTGQYITTSSLVCISICLAISAALIFFRRNPLDSQPDIQHTQEADREI